MLVSYFWISIILSVLCLTLESSYKVDAIPDQKASNYRKNFRRKLDLSKRVHILESGSRPLPQLEESETEIPKLSLQEIIQEGTTEEYENEDVSGGSTQYYQDNLSTSKDDEILKGQESFISFGILPGLKKIQSQPIFYPSYGRKRRPIRPRPTPTIYSQSTLLPYKPYISAIPSTTSGLTTIPIVTITIPPSTLDSMDLGTFPSLVQELDETIVIPPNQPGTVVPILGGRSSKVPKLNDGLTSSRSLFGSRSLPQRRLVGGGNLKTNSRENFKEVKGIEEDPGSIITDYMFSEIKCFRTRQKEYFGAMVHLKSGLELPYIRDRPQDPLSSNDCLMEPTDSPNSYHMKITDLRSCGVEQCGDQAMCLTMVFPRVAMLALADDEVTTIKCIPQKNTMAETRTISFAGDSSESRRSSSTVEGGGQEFFVEVGVFRQNPGLNNGLFIKRVNSGGIVKLGEPLQLRSVIRGGDGWTFSKLTDVKVWRMRGTYSHNVDKLNPNDASEVITLVDQNGCKNKDYKVISDTHPLRDPRNDLVHHFNFKAFLFRGQRSNEPMILTAKVQACQERDDCILTNCLTDSDTSDDRSRIKRSSMTDIKNSSFSIQDWNSQLALRVVGLKDHSFSISEENFISNNHNEDKNISNYTCTDKIVGSIVAGNFTMLLLCTLGFTLLTFCQRNRLRQTPPQLLTSHTRNSSSSSNPSNSILKRNPSFYPDFIRKTGENESSKLDKPNSSATNLSILSQKEDGFLKSDVAKLLHELSIQNENVSSEESIVNDSIPEDRNNKLNSYEIPSKNNTKTEPVYIVYCCKRETSQKRSKSVPGSFREKMKLSKNLIDENNGDTNFEETEVSDSFPENSIKEENEERRTVRNIKKRSQHYRHKGSQHQKVNALYNYRDGSNTNTSYYDHHHGSFPTRINSRKSLQVGVGTRSCRERKHVNFSKKYVYDDIFPQLSSDDSAYSGSISSKQIPTGSSHDLFQNRSNSKKYCKTSQLLNSSLELVESIVPVHETNSQFQNTSTCTPVIPPKYQNADMSNTNFITMIDTSKQIITIPQINYI